jgi:hypothetical protein
LVYSCHTIKFQHLELIQCTHWLQGISDRGVSYKAMHDPYSKMLIETSNETKKLFHVPKDKIVLVLDSVAHFTGEEA